MLIVGTFSAVNHLNSPPTRTPYPSFPLQVASPRETDAHCDEWTPGKEAAGHSGTVLLPAM